MEQRDFYLREIEKIMVLVSKILKHDNKSVEPTNDLRESINNEYQRLFSISESELFIHNDKIQEILNYQGNEIRYIQKLESFILLLEHDYLYFNKKNDLRVILYSLIKKIIQIDSKNYHPDRIAKLAFYEKEII